MRIEGSVRANLIAAVTSARRLRGQRVHRDTIAYWRQLLDYARAAGSQPHAEALGDLTAELETELMKSRAA